MDVLISKGEQLGLSGKDLVKFIESQQAVEREERRERREAEKAAKAEEDERKLELKRLEVEEKRLAAEEAQRKFDAEEAQRKIDAEQKRIESEQKVQMEKMRLDHEVELERARSSQVTGGGSINSKAKTPRLPTFVDGKDELDTYLERFERYAGDQGWKKEEWASSLSALLTGKALGVYVRLSRDEAKVYDKVKDALLTRYQLTEEGFRMKFRESPPEVGESPGQFLTRIGNYLESWMKLAKAEATFEGLRQLVIMEQFLNMCPKELAVYLKERPMESMDEVAKTSEKFLQAHGKTLASGQGKRDDRKSQNPQQRTAQQKDSGGKNEKSKDRECYNCRRTGHERNQCRQKGGGNETRCTTCGLYGHESSRCRRDKKQLAASNSAKPEERQDLTEVSALCHGKSDADVPEEVRMNMDFSVMEDKKECILLSWNRKDRVDEVLKVTKGKIGEHIVSTLRDSGCSTICVNKELVKPEQLTGETYTCLFLNGSTLQAPVAIVDVDTPYLKKSRVKALCLEDPAYDLVIGDVEGARCKCDPDPDWRLEEANAVTTRSQAKASNKLLKPLKVTSNDGSDVDVTPDVLKKLQKDDETLNKVRSLTTITERGSRKYFYSTRSGILYRIYQPDASDSDNTVSQVVVPKPLRPQVMSLAHESIMGGHLGIKKTFDKVTTSFYWPGIHGDITRYCQSCDVCQKTISKGKVVKVPLERMPLIDVPFKRVAIDIIGKIYPTTESGYRYILTMVCYAIRYPEAVPLKHISTEAVAEALVSMFSRLGVLEEVLSDQGSQFMSEIMVEVSRLLSIKRLVSSPYHPICNGLCEKFNGVLKKMLKRLCEKKPKDWDRYIDAALFAYREAPQESTGFSSFELLYGRTVRGPVQILKELWTEEVASPEVRTSYQYVVDLRERIEEGVAQAHNALEQAQGRYKRYYDKKARSRKFKVGDEVLILLPTDSNKLLMQWKGPFKVKTVIAVNDYQIDVDGKLKIYHANLLKKYYRRNSEQPIEVGASVIHLASAAVVEAGEVDPEGAVDDEALLELGYAGGKENHTDVKVNPNLDAEQERALRDKVSEFKSIFTDMPGLTNLVEHRIPLTSDTPIRCKPYAIPYNCRESLRKETQKMLDMGIIERSNTPYASPPVVVGKRDGTDRVCIDYGKLNRISVFDPEPVPTSGDIFLKVSKALYLSTIDFSKGYWQIPVAKEDVHKTGFVTPDGTFVFLRTPFGMVNSGATFNRMMRKLLDGIPNVSNYIDDVVVYTETWEEHLEVLDKLFQRIKNANLHVRPSKCILGATSVDFLGHHIGGGEISLQEYNVEKVRQAERPTSKKQVRSFLGLTGFYRNYIPNYSTIAAPLTDLTKKGSPNRVVWGDPQERAFVTLKQHLTSYPVLKLPDMSKPYILRTDASDIGVGAVLMQEHDNELFPVAFASKKLSKRERAYSTMERECLALVWAVQKFQLYLYGKAFVLQTDHQPLVYLNRAKLSNSRIMRWALFLQSYSIHIEAIKGSLNVGADYMSRIY